MEGEDSWDKISGGAAGPGLFCYTAAAGLELPAGVPGGALLPMGQRSAREVRKVRSLGDLAGGVQPVHPWHADVHVKFPPVAGHLR
jgi:hypothetical protein